MQSFATACYGKKQQPFTFRVTLTAEGQRPDAGTLQRLNELLAEIQTGWKLE